MGDTINAITIGELFLMMGGCGALYVFVKNIIAPIVRKWLKIEDNSTKIKGLPELIATQQQQIDHIIGWVGTIEKNVSALQIESTSSQALLKSMDMKLEILVNAQMGVHQSEEDIELLNKVYKDKKLEQLKK